MNCKLTITWPDEEKTFLLKNGDNALGRDGSSAIQIISDQASRSHAVIHVSDSSADIKDLDSANGTVVKGFIKRLFNK